MKLQSRQLSRAVLVDRDGSIEKVDLLRNFQVELCSDDDPELRIPIKYEIVNFDSDYLQIQIDNQDSVLVEAPMEFKTIRIIFYGTDFFKS